MLKKPEKSLDELVAHVGRYPPEAFLFVQKGLSVAANMVHGPESELHRQLFRELAGEGLDWSELIRQYHAGNLSEPLVRAIDSLGGFEKLNRHVGGRELCAGLRESALKRWGLLAKTVLDSWNIRSTMDFGRIVFAFIEFDMMQKQPEDRLEDFDEVYSFDDAFKDTHRLEFGGQGADRSVA